MHNLFNVSIVSPQLNVEENKTMIVDAAGVEWVQFWICNEDFVAVTWLR